MNTSKKLARRLVLLGSLLALFLVAVGCAEEKQSIKFHDGQWETLWQHNAIAMYIVEHGYGYPVEEIQGTTGTMLVALPEGELDVNMEGWRRNIQTWYDEKTANGKIVDLAGTDDIVPNGSKGQILETSDQGWYVPTYMIKGDPARGIEATAPNLKTVFDLVNPEYRYWELVPDPEESSKGVWVNCIIGWQCQKIYRAKSYAYGLDEYYNVMEPGSAGAIDANIYGMYEAGEPFLTYYWEPTKIVTELDLTRLEQPEWTQECHDALQAAVQEEPYQVEEACADQAYDVHVLVNSSLIERAPEVTGFLANMFVGALPLADLASWKKDNNKTWRQMAIYYLRNNEATLTTWVPSDVAGKVKDALAKEA